MLYNGSISTPIVWFIMIQTLAITDIYNSPFYVSVWSHFSQTYLCKQPTLFSEALLPQTKNIPSPHRCRLYVPADRCCLPTFKHVVKTTQNLNTSESTTVWHRDQWRVLSDAKNPPQNAMCVCTKRQSLLLFRFTEATRPALNAKLEISETVRL